MRLRFYREDFFFDFEVCEDEVYMCVFMYEVFLSLSLSLLRCVPVFPLFLHDEREHGNECEGFNS